MSGGEGEPVDSGGWSRGSGPRCRMAAAVRMNIQMLLEAADYLERRERGARERGGVWPHSGPGVLRGWAADRSASPRLCGGWLGAPRACRERSQPLQRSPCALQKEAAAAPKAMNGGSWLPPGFPHLSGPASGAAPRLACLPAPSPAAGPAEPDLRDVASGKARLASSATCCRCQQ